MTPFDLPLAATVYALHGAVVWIDRRGRLYAGGRYLGETVEEALVAAAELTPAAMWGEA